MLKIASQVKMETSTIIQYIIDSIIDNEVNKIILYGAKSISELEIEVNLIEAMKSRSKHFKLDERKQKSLRGE